MMKKRIKKIVFVHIPKTAGSTFKRIIMNQYSEGEYIPIYNRADIEQNFTNHFHTDKVKAIFGHFFFPDFIQGEIDIEQHKLMTFLRNPVARVISNFHHSLQSDKPKTIEYMKDLQTLEKFAAWKGQLNIQTQFISGLNIADFNKDPEKGYEIAEKNLRKYFSLIGITERFDESMTVIYDRLPWQKKPYISYNVRNSLSKQSVDTETKKLIEKLNYLDLKLYNLGNELLDEHIKKTPFFKLKQAVLRFKNKLYTARVERWKRKHSEA